MTQTDLFPVSDTPHGERAHASVSPSTLANRDVCPHHEGQSSEVVHPMTESGTRIHEAFESGDMSALDDEERSLLQYCNAYVDDVLGEREAWRVDYEAKLATHEPDTWGYADLVAVQGDVAHLIDPKTGQNLQTVAAENLQMQAYVVGILLAFEGVQRVVVHLVYPRLDFVSVATYERAQLSELQAKISKVVEGVKAARGGERLYTYDRANCRYCRHAGRCPAWDGVHEKLALASGAAVQLPTNLDLVDLAKRPDDFAKLLDVLPAIEKFAKEARQHALAAVMSDGVAIPGYKHVTTSGRLAVKDPKLARQLAADAGLDAAEIDACGTLSGPKLAKAVAKHHAKNKAAVERDFRDALLEHGAAKIGAEFYSLRSC